MPQGVSPRRKTYPGSGVASRFRALLLTHRSLEEKLETELKRPLPDTATLRRLKRRKLTIKDELEAIQRLLEAMRTAGEGRQVVHAI
ncbi:YdcH family protein [Pelagibius litoralis]|uniref:YdcH family protein n=1 Tax=Pelagibius litoralis TaxID=374515 RepID=A0A967EYI8_9PROT|nr:YdcH family protein [Pelagibius litoralis]NIA69791.1 YdcH family protein [Pelagibius litoralis]